MNHLDKLKHEQVELEREYIDACNREKIAKKAYEDAKNAYKDALVKASDAAKALDKNLDLQLSIYKILYPDLIKKEAEA